MLPESRVKGPGKQGNRQLKKKTSGGSGPTISNWKKRQNRSAKVVLEGTDLQRAMEKGRDRCRGLENRFVKKNSGKDHS